MQLNLSEFSQKVLNYYLVQKTCIYYYTGLPTQLGHPVSFSIGICMSMIETQRQVVDLFVYAGFITRQWVWLLKFQHNSGYPKGSFMQS